MIGTAGLLPNNGESNGKKKTQWRGGSYRDFGLRAYCGLRILGNTHAIYNSKYNTETKSSLDKT